MLGRLTRDRRDILDALNEQSLPITERHLAALLAADGWGDRSTTQARTKLRHVDLPTLADAGYITLDESAAVVTDINLSNCDVTGDELDTVDSTDALKDDLRIAVQLVETLHGPQCERDFASGVAAISASAKPDPDAVEKTAIKLRHYALPTLSQLGLVEYDPDEGVVAAADSLD